MAIFNSYVKLPEGTLPPKNLRCEVAVIFCDAELLMEVTPLRSCSATSRQSPPGDATEMIRFMVISW